MGLLGPSGCGKTSLLECLHSCTPTSSHQLFYNSQPLTSTLARTHFAYLPQEDVLPSYMTVSEYLLFCAQLYEPSLTSVMCVNGVAYLLQRLDLEQCAQVSIDQISGGQKRRVSVCSVLIRSGRLKDSQGRRMIRALLLDEPLTGLDSTTAVSMMTELKRTSRGLHPKPQQPQRIVIMSLHQPTKRIFKQLDYLIILGAQQNLLFSGTRQEAEDMFRPTIGTTVAEIALSVASTVRWDLHGGGEKVHDEQTDLEKAHRERCGSFDQKNKEGLEAHSPDSTTELDYDWVVERARKKLGLWNGVQFTNPTTTNPTTTNPTTFPTTVAVAAASARPTTAASYYHQCTLLSRRACFRLLRKQLLLRLHIAITIVFSIVVCLLWSPTTKMDSHSTTLMVKPSNNKPTNDFEDLHNRMGCLFFMVSFFGFSSLSALTTFLDERPLFMKERHSSLYNINVYVFVEILFDLIPLRILPPLIMGCIIYYPVQLRTDPVETFPRFLILLVLANTGFACASLFIGSMASKTSVATFSGGLFMLGFLAFGGVFLSLKNIPSMLAWMPYLTPSKFAYDGLVKNELVNVTFSIGTGTVIPGIGELKANVRGDQILDRMGFDISRYTPISVDIGALFVVPLGYLFCTWLVVKFRHTKY